MRFRSLDTVSFSSSDFQVRLKIKMEKSEQRIVIKYFVMKGLGSRFTYSELTSVLQDSAYSLSAIGRWVSRFKKGFAKCEDDSRRGRPPSDLGSSVTAFLMEFPFASAQRMSRHFPTSHHTIKEILSRELGLSKFSRRWVPHTLSDDQKVNHVQDSRALLAILQR
jgi:transposase